MTGCGESIETEKRFYQRSRCCKAHALADEVTASLEHAPTRRKITVHLTILILDHVSMHVQLVHDMRSVTADAVCAVLWRSQRPLIAPWLCTWTLVGKRAASANSAAASIPCQLSMEPAGLEVTVHAGKHFDVRVLRMQFLAVAAARLTTLPLVGCSVLYACV